MLGLILLFALNLYANDFSQQLGITPKQLFCVPIHSTTTGSARAELSLSLFNSSVWKPILKKSSINKNLFVPKAIKIVIKSSYAHLYFQHMRPGYLTPESNLYAKNFFFDASWSEQAFAQFLEKEYARRHLVLLKGDFAVVLGMLFPLNPTQEGYFHSEICTQKESRHTKEEMIKQYDDFIENLLNGNQHFNHESFSKKIINLRNYYHDYLVKGVLIENQLREKLSSNKTASTITLMTLLSSTLLILKNTMPGKVFSALGFSSIGGWAYASDELTRNPLLLMDQKLAHQELQMHWLEGGYLFQEKALHFIQILEDKICQDFPTEDFCY